MAKIQTDQKQLDALEEVNQKLDVIKAINEIAFQTEGALLISYSRSGNKKPGKKKEQDVVLAIDSNEGAKLATILIQYKHKMRKEIERLVKQYNLALDDEETASLRDDQGAVEETDALKDEQEGIEKESPDNDQEPAGAVDEDTEAHEPSGYGQSSSY